MPTKQKKIGIYTEKYHGLKLPVAKLSITPMHNVDAIAASTAFPPFFKTNQN